jgi:hypothetical protein
MKTYLCLLSSTLLFAACDTAIPPVDRVVVLSQEAGLDDEVLNANTKKQGDAHSGQYYSSFDAKQQFGLGRSFFIPDSLKGKRLVVYVSAWVREREAPIEGGLAMQLSNGQETLKFQVFKPADTQSAGKWVQIRDSIRFGSQSLKTEHAELKAFGFKDAGPDSLDIDDIQLTYKFY